MHGLGGTQPGEHPTVTGSARNLARIFGEDFLKIEKRIFACKTGTRGVLNFFRFVPRRFDVDVYSIVY